LIPTPSSDATIPAIYYIRLCTKGRGREREERERERGRRGGEITYETYYAKSKYFSN
jgi:hypothetical protein